MAINAHELAGTSMGNAVARALRRKWVGCWERWYAWHPVRQGLKRWACLRHVERRPYLHITSSGRIMRLYQYREVR